MSKKKIKTELDILSKGQRDEILKWYKLKEAEMQIEYLTEQLKSAVADYAKLKKQSKKKHKGKI